MNTSQISSLIRSLMKLASGAFIAHGYLRLGNLMNTEDIIAAAIGFVVCIWSHLEHSSNSANAAGTSSNTSRGAMLALFLLAGFSCPAFGQTNPPAGDANVLAAFPPFPTGVSTNGVLIATKNGFLKEVQIGLKDGINALKDASFKDGLNVAPLFIYHDGDLGGGVAVSPVVTNGISYGFAMAVISETSTINGVKKTSIDFYDASISLTYNGSVKLPLLGECQYYAETGIAFDLADPLKAQYSQSSAGIQKTWVLNDNDSITLGGGVLYLSKWSDPGYIGFLNFTTKLHGKYLFGLI